MDTDWAQTVRVCELYMLGHTVEQIAEKTGYDHWKIHETIREQAEQCRDNLTEDIEEAFMRQKLGLEHVYKRCMDEIERKNDLGIFAEAAIKCLIQICDRQGKLLGMDKGARPGGNGDYNWLKGASEDDLRKAAEKRGLRLPKPITPTDS